MDTPAPAVVVITGASGGIGSALAEAYAAPGVVLGLSGRDAERLEAVAARCRARGAVVETAALDVTDAQGMSAWLTAFDAAHPIGLVIANAGVSSAIGPGGEPESPAAIERTFAVNLMGVLHTLTPVVPALRARRRGQIAIIGSLAAWYGLPSSPSYSASKAAVETYGQSLRGWLREYGVGVTVISPGFVASPMSARYMGRKPFLMPAGRAARLIRRGIAANRARVSFPFPLNLGTWLLHLLPEWLARLVLPAFRFHVAPEAPPPPETKP